MREERTIVVEHEDAESIDRNILTRKYVRVLNQETCDGSIRIVCWPCWLFYCCITPQENSVQQ